MSNTSKYPLLFFFFEKKKKKKECTSLDIQKVVFKLLSRLVKLVVLSLSLLICL